MPSNVTDNFRVSAPKDIDDRSGVYASGTHRPYNDVAEANAAIEPEERFEGLTVRIKIDGNLQEYWYIGGIDDDDLKRKNHHIIVGPINADGSFTLKAGNYCLGFMVKASALGTDFKIGTSIGGDELSGPAQELPANSTHPMMNAIYADADTTIYFSGLNGVNVTITALIM